MGSSRRQFLTTTALGLAGAVAAGRAAGAAPDAGVQAPPGSPPVTGASAGVGPEVSAATFAEAEKLTQAPLTPAERALAASNWRESMAGLAERRTGPRQVALEPSLAPASTWDPALPGLKAGPARDRFVRSKGSRRAAAGEGRGHRLRPRDGALALDRSAGADLGAADAHLPGAAAALRSAAQVRDHPDAGAGAGAGAAGGRGDRGGPVPRARCTASPGAPRTWWTPRASPPPRGAEPFRDARAGGGRGGGGAAARGGRGAGGQAEPGRAGAERRLVRRPDQEPVAAGGGLVGQQRGAGLGDGGGAAWASRWAARPAAASSRRPCAAAWRACGPRTAGCRAPAP